PLIIRALRFYGIYEPPYLKQKELKIPNCPTLNIQIKGYKYPLLESYQSFIHKLAKALNVTVEDSFPFPHAEFKIKRFKRGTAVVDAEYQLKIYERDVQISNVSSIKYPIFIRLLEATLPEGVSLCIDQYDPVLQKNRLIPNKELLDIKSDLNELLESKNK
ncbi:39S ribosomal protein L48, mitochondrial, partial [Habropoda laboriosa]